MFLNKGASRTGLEPSRMEGLETLVHGAALERLERDIRLAKAGVSGERKIVYELEGSHCPLVFAHDLDLHLASRSVQVDFLIVTPYNLVVLECKNLVGDIE